MRVTLDAYGFNDIVSSIRIGMGGWGPQPPPPPQPWPQPQPGPHPHPGPMPPPNMGSACFYRDAGFSGGSFCLNRGAQIRNLGNSAGWNDSISSIRIPWGFRVTVCQHADYQGFCQTYSSDVFNFADIGFNDQISSIYVQ